MIEPPHQPLREYQPDKTHGGALPEWAEVEALAAKNAELQKRLERAEYTQHARCLGVFDGATTSKHLGEAALARGFSSRTARGDAYEEGFLLARGLASRNRLREALVKIKSIGEGRRHYDTDDYTCWDALGDIRQIAEEAL